MIVASAAVLVLLAFGAAQRASAPPPQDTITVRQQQIMIRTRGIRPVMPAGSPMIEWRESRGPRCVVAGRVVGATLLRQNSVDLILRDNRRIRAQLHRRCPALDYYRGFYVDATPDGQVCADRDSIRSRAGGECQIDSFRLLTPHRP